MQWCKDPRFGNLLQAVDLSSDESTEAVIVGKTISTAVTSNEAEQSATDRIQIRVAHLLYVLREEIDVTQALLKYGIDSMVAGEFKNWIFEAFGKEISLCGLLYPAITIEKLSIEVESNGES